MVSFALTDEQAMFRDALGRFLREEYDFETRRRRIKAAPHDSQLWGDFSNSLGLLGASLPERFGGLGGGAVEIMITMEALGSALVVEPFLETVVIGAGLLKRAGGDQAEELLAGISEGRVRLAFAHSEPGSQHALTDVRTRAYREDGGWRIQGRKSVVIAAPSATHWLLLARTSGDGSDRQGLSLFLLSPDTPGVERHDYRLIDDRPASDLLFQDVLLPTNSLIGAPDEALPRVEAVFDEAVAGLCAEATGVLRRMLGDTIIYMKQRRQFGHALAEFQALRHRVVDMFMEVEQASAAALLATLRLGADDKVRGLATSAAKATIAKAARFVGQNAVQLHGAMGLTDELAISHYFKRATVIEYQFGSVDDHRARYALLSRPENMPAS